MKRVSDHGPVATQLLYGREAELAALRGLIETVEDGGSAVIVRGDAGIGKSTLLAAAQSDAGSAGMEVLNAAGVQSEAQLPFAGLHQLLRPLLPHLDHLPSPQRAALEAAFGISDDAAPDLFLIALATLELLGEAAARRPLLLVVEDAHMLDRSTVDVLAFVARRVSLEPIVLVIAVRDDMDDPFAAANLSELRLEPLDDATAGDLLDDHAPDLAPGVRARVLDQAAGNPLALVELPNAIGPALDGTTVLPDHLPLSTRLEQAFAARLFDLPEQTRTLLLLAACDGASVVDELVSAAEILRGSTPAPDALAPAVAERLIALNESHVRFRHPLVASAVYQAASMPERLAAHAALARVLADRPDRSVWHRAAATVGRDETVASELEQTAARSRRRGALGSAVAAFERAAQLSEAAPEAARRLLAAAELASELGRADVVLPLLAAVEPFELNPLERGRVAWIREMFSSRPLDGAAVRFFLETAEEAEAAGDPDLALDALTLVAGHCWRSDLGQVQRERGIAAADSFGTVDGDLRVLAILSYLAPLARGQSVLDRLSRTTKENDADALRLLGVAGVVIGAFDLASGLLASAASELRAQGRLGQLPRVLAAQATAASRLSDWNVAIPAAEECVALATEIGQPVWVGVAKSARAIAAAVRGDEDEADALAAEAEEIGVRLGARFLPADVQLGRGALLLALGRYADATAQLQRVHDANDRAFHAFIRWWGIGDLAEAAVYAGQGDAVRPLVDELMRLTDAPVSFIQIGLRFARAVLAADDEAEELFQEALGPDVNRWPFQRARLLLAYGAWLRRQRRVAESRTPLRAARDAFDALGARPWGERARQELRASGESSRRREPSARDELTPQELQIAQLAATGQTNREIGQQLYLSHRTVGSHLYRIFPKLGITSRSQLGAALDVTPSG